MWLVKIRWLLALFESLLITLLCPGCLRCSFSPVQRILDYCIVLGWASQWLRVKNLPANTGDTGDREAWWATVHGVTKSQTRLSDVTYLLTLYFRKPTKTVLSVDMYFPSLLFRGVFSRNAAKQLCI